MKKTPKKQISIYTFFNQFSIYIQKREHRSTCINAQVIFGLTKYFAISCRTRSRKDCNYDFDMTEEKVAESEIYLPVDVFDFSFSSPVCLLLVSSFFAVLLVNAFEDGVCVTMSPGPAVVVGSPFPLLVVGIPWVVLWDTSALSVVVIRSSRP